MFSSSVADDAFYIMHTGRWCGGEKTKVPSCIPLPCKIMYR